MLGVSDVRSGWVLQNERPVSPKRARTGLQADGMHRSRQVHASRRAHPLTSVRGAALPGYGQSGPASPRGSARPRPGVLVAAGSLGAAALGVWQTGLLAAAPAGAGLTVLAASDLMVHRFSLRTLNLAALLTSTCLVVESLRAPANDQLVVATALTGLVAIAAFMVWVGTSGVAFGDVLLLSFAVVLPAWLSPRSAAVAVAVAVATAGAVAMWQRHRRAVADPAGTVALGPALLMGWVVAVVVG